MARGSIQFYAKGILVAVGIACTNFSAACLEQKKAIATKAAEPNAPVGDMKQFCGNNLAIAGDARIAWQTSKLREIEAKINRRIEELEAMKAQFVEWSKKHEEALKKANDGLVSIFLHMKPDAAASQLAVMDDATAAAVLAKIPARAASSILNEMEASRAAQLTRTMIPPEISDGKRS
ncbi:hypothetical protein CU048_04680 [Beijerinckiaceae bacterium]|nr:hypothetical protein CU048_04680 [Beijerinckiaceae bacterium]